LGRAELWLVLAWAKLSFGSVSAGIFLPATAAAAAAGPNKSPKMRHLGTIVQFRRTISSQLRHVSTIGKKNVKQQYLLYMS